MPLCLVCEDECDVQLDPCGHITVCSKCGQRLKKCPTCKASQKNWAGLRWAGLRWAGLRWAGLRWAGLG